MRHDAPLAAVDRAQFVFAEVTDADLHEPRHAVHLFEHVVEDRCVAPAKALVGDAQVGVGIHVQHTKTREGRRRGSDRAERHRVIAADHADDLARGDQLLGGAVSDRIDQLAGGIDGPNRLGVLGQGAAAGDDRCTQVARLFVHDRQNRVRFEHVDAKLVGPPKLVVVEIYLATGREDGRRPPLRPTAIGDGCCKGHRDQHDGGLVLVMRQTEDAGVRRRRGARIECNHGSQLPGKRDLAQRKGPAKGLSDGAPCSVIAAV